MQKLVPMFLSFLLVLGACGEPVEESTSTSSPSETTMSATITEETSTAESTTKDTSSREATTTDEDLGRGDTITPDSEPEPSAPEVRIESAADLAEFPSPASNPSIYDADGVVNCAYIEYVTRNLKQIGGYCEAQGDALSGSPIAATRWYGLASKAAQLEGEYWALLSQGSCY